MVAATVFVVAFADMGREVNLSRLIDITGETSLALAIRDTLSCCPDDISQDENDNSP